ncbi:ABC transporter permease [Nesterenkonia ebinurensis]|uniref:ABC transporter permease n=1 Tax=Nesterenkonia ebinurensis TaxID=2608252 RepID=UPI00123CAF1E|nr:ABC transporter permease [Nesterenkonia ebinurensis]
MTGFILRRVVQLVIVLAIVSVALFLLLRLLPGDPTTTILGTEATHEQREILRAELGLDQPLIVQFGQWILSVFNGDLGESWITGEPVSAVMSDRLPVTVQLGVMSLLGALLIGVPAGVLAAVRRRSTLDTALTGAGVFFLAIPNFFLGPLLVLLFALSLGWAPPSGFVNFTDDPIANLIHMVLPAVTVGSMVVAVVMRQARGAMLDSLGGDYIRTAKATGLSRGRVVMVYALRNALLPVITVTGLQVGALLSGTIVTETIFTLPGMGSLIVNSIFSRDLPVVQGAVLLIVVAVLLINLVTDLIYAWLDPRIVYDAA